MSGTEETICDKWHQLLKEIELARNYPLFEPKLHAARNPVLDAILASLLHVNATTILDDALAKYIQRESLAQPSSFKKNLHGRICFLDDARALCNADALHAIRQRRNGVAHEPDNRIDLKHLERDVAIIHAELQHLGFVGALPKYEFFSSVSKDGPDSTDPRVLFTYHHRCGVKLHGETVLEVYWPKHAFRSRPLEDPNCAEH